ncbi:MAG: hypothetical protein ACJ72C_10800 [Nitrososphaeraceae archaeon]
MKTKTALVMSLIAASMAIALASIIAPPALADRTSAQQGLETADDAIHEHPGSGSSADQGFHSGTCNGGFSVHDFRC